MLLDPLLQASSCLGNMHFVAFPAAKVIHNDFFMSSSTAVVTFIKDRLSLLPHVQHVKSTCIPIVDTLTQSSHLRLLRREGRVNLVAQCGDHPHELPWLAWFVVS